MKNRVLKQMLGAIFAAVLLLFSSAAFAENIDPDNDGSQYAWGENVGWLNLEPDGDIGPGVEVSDFELTGYIWGENIGWINLNPIEGGVENDGCGTLSGYAWGENVGWINFEPGGGGVFINPDTGVFSGHAWGENIGWINFAPTSGGVKTSWRGVSGGGGLAVISEAKLTASDAAAGDRFGGSVGISGDTAIVGRGYAGGQFAYVFSYDGTNWVEEAKLTASDAAAGDYFGDSVGISGDTAIVGAWGDDDAGDRSGSAYVFSYDGTNWVEEAKLTASDAAAHDCFGRSVAIDGDTILVGATGTDLDTMNASGSVYVFQRSGTTWTQEAKLTASDAEASDEFGCSVAIDGDTILVGAWGNDDECPSNIYCNSGSAYVFRRSGTTWTQEAKLTASDAAQHDMFGRSVVITGDTVAVAAMSEGFYIRPGSVYVFQRSGTTWTQEAKLTAGDAAQHDYFGVSIAMGEDTMVVRAHRTDDACPGDMHCDSGSAYVYILAAETPAGNCIVAQPVDTTTGTYPVRLIFSEVIQAGETSLTTSSTGPAPPSGFQMGDPPTYYDLGTTAVFSGSVTVCIDYSGVGFGDETQLKLYHYENGGWVDATLSLDTENDIICGTVVDSLSPFAIFESVVVDSDGDGVPDDMDSCDDSNIEATVTIDGCDSGVENYIFEDGCTMSDLIAECADDADNHGEFVSCVSHLTNDWKKEGLISGKEKGAIQSCAAQADIP